MPSARIAVSLVRGLVLFSFCFGFALLSRLLFLYCGLGWISKQLRGSVSFSPSENWSVFPFCTLNNYLEIDATCSTLRSYAVSWRMLTQRLMIVRSLWPVTGVNIWIRTFSFLFRVLFIDIAGNILTDAKQSKDGSFHSFIFQWTRHSIMISSSSQVVHHSSSFHSSFLCFIAREIARFCGVRGLVSCLKQNLNSRFGLIKSAWCVHVNSVSDSELFLTGGSFTRSHYIQSYFVHPP